MRSFAPLLALAVAGACSEAAHEAARRERVFDFLARLSEARVESQPAFLPQRTTSGDEIENTDDPYLCIDLPADAVLRFDAVRVHPGARLAYGFGPAKGKAAGAAGAVRFSIRVAAAGRPPLELERRLDPAAPGFAREFGELDLGSFAGASAEFAFRTEAEGGAAVDWPAWYELRLESEGRARQAEDALARVERVAADFLRIAPEGAEHLDAARDLAGGALSCPPGPPLWFAVEVPRRARLEFSPQASGATFIFEIDVDGERIYREEVGPSEVKPERRRVSLERFAGRGAVIAFGARARHPGPLPADASAAWIFPRLVEERRIERSPRRDGEWNLLVILVDTLRASMLGCYGSPRGASPNLDRFARDCLVFEDVLAQSSWTLPSVASLLTGLRPPAHGVTDERHTFLGDAVDTLAERLLDAGFATGAIVANPLVSRSSNFHQGFETFQRLAWANAKKVDRRLLDWIDDHRGERFFAYAHAIDPHAPYAAPEPFANVIATPGDPFLEPGGELRLGQAADEFVRAGDAGDATVQAALQHVRDQYASEVWYWDRCFGELLEGLAERDLLDSTIVVVTSDHGEEFLDHGMLFHGPQLYQETVRVPLLLRVPGIPGRRVDSPAELVDVAPTLLALLGLAPDSRLDGVDALRAPRNGARFSATALGQIAGVPGRFEQYCVLFRRWKHIATPAVGRVELFDLAADPGERRNLAPAEPGTVGRLAALLQSEYLDAGARRSRALPDLDPAALRLMQEAGYLK